MIPSEDKDWEQVLVFSVLCFFGTSMFAYGSRKLMKKAKLLINISAMMCISIGVFASILLNSFQPELYLSENEFKNKYCSSNTQRVPIAGLSILFGILIMFVTDAIIHQNTTHTALVNGSVASTKDHSIIILLLGIGVHSLLEGIPIGIRNEGFWPLAISLLIHKCIESTTIAAGLTETGRVKAYTCIATYAAMTPVGVLLGAVIDSSERTPSKELIMLVLQGLATGLITFIAFIEMMPRIVESKELKLLGKCVFILLGFFIISVFSAVAEHHFGDHVSGNSTHY